MLTEHEEAKRIEDLAREALGKAKSVDELRAAQSIVLPAEQGLTLEQTAVLLGVSRATVTRFRARFRQAHPSSSSPCAASGDSGGGAERGTPAGSWGGRRRCCLTQEQEKAFLAPWLAQAAAGHLVVVSPVWAALEQQLGRRVKASVVYRMLERHGWRKVAPDTRHPSSDPAVQQGWKKNFRTTWRPC